MNLYESIYVRKSVRHYQTEELSQKAIEEFKKFIADLEPLFPEIKIKIEKIISELKG